jgi:hypothetical protein
MSESPRRQKPGLRLVLGCFGLALVMLAALVLYIVVGHRAAVGPYEGPPQARP